MSQVVQLRLEPIGTDAHGTGGFKLMLTARRHHEGKPDIDANLC